MAAPMPKSPTASAAVQPSPPEAVSQLGLTSGSAAAEQAQPAAAPPHESPTMSEPVPLGLANGSAATEQTQPVAPHLPMPMPEWMAQVAAACGLDSGLAAAEHALPLAAPLTQLPPTSAPAPTTPAKVAATVGLARGSADHQQETAKPAASEAKRARKLLAKQAAIAAVPASVMKRPAAAAAKLGCSKRAVEDRDVILATLASLFFRVARTCLLASGPVWRWMHRAWGRPSG